MIPENNYKESLSQISKAISLYNRIDKQQWELACLHTKLENKQIFKQPKNVSIFRCILSGILLIFSLVFLIVIAVQDEYDNKQEDLIAGAGLLVATVTNAIYLTIKKGTYQKRCNRFSNQLTNSALAVKTAKCESELSEAKAQFNKICKGLCIPSYARDILSLESFQDDLQTRAYFDDCSSVQEWSKKRFDKILLERKIARDREESNRTKRLADEFDAKERIGEYIIEGPSIWYDFRTGERLKETIDGKIVNSEGEEVSPAWWD